MDLTFPICLSLLPNGFIHRKAHRKAWNWHRVLSAFFWALFFLCKVILTEYLCMTPIIISQLVKTKIYFKNCLYYFTRKSVLLSNLYDFVIFVNLWPQSSSSFSHYYALGDWGVIEYILILSRSVWDCMDHCIIEEL